MQLNYFSNKQGWAINCKWPTYSYPYVLPRLEPKDQMDTKQLKSDLLERQISWVDLANLGLHGCYGGLQGEKESKTKLGVCMYGTVHKTPLLCKTVFLLLISKQYLFWRRLPGHCLLTAGHSPTGETRSQACWVITGNKQEAAAWESCTRVGELWDSTLREAKAGALSSGGGHLEDPEEDPS